MVDEIITIDIALLDEQVSVPDENMALIIHKLTAPRATRIFKFTSLAGWLLSAGVITSDMIASHAVTDDKISPAAVGTTHIEESAITAALIAAGAVTSEKIGAGAVTDDKISPSAVGTTHIEESAITAALIAAGAVTNTKIGSGAVTGPKIGKEYTNQETGIGNVSEGVPARDDTEAVHTLEGSYTNSPMVFITPKAALMVYLKSVVVLNHVCTITLGLSNPNAVDPYYDLIVISMD